jgi:hypothetical protein
MMNNTEPLLKEVVFNCFTDARGLLAVSEHFREFDLAAKRTFFIGFPDDEGSLAPRAEHAPSCNQILVLVRGAIQVDVDNGTEKCEWRCDTPFRGLYLASGIWRRVIALEPGSLVMVLADASYEETVYHSTPMPV